MGAPACFFSVSPDTAGSRCASKTTILIIMLFMCCCFSQYERSPLQQCWFKHKNTRIWFDCAARHSDETRKLCVFVTYSTYNVRNWGSCSLKKNCSLKTAGSLSKWREKKLGLVSATKKRYTVNLHDFMGSFVCEGANKHVKAGRLGDVQPATTFPSQFAANSAITKGEKHVFFSQLHHRTTELRVNAIHCQFTQAIHGPGRETRK